MMLHPKKGLHTPEEYFALEESTEYKSEYYHGEIFAMAGATPDHNQITVNLITILHTALQQTPCRVFTSDMKIQVEAGRHYAYPDVSVVCGELQFGEGRNDLISNPVMIVEVLSESTKDYDRGSKFAAYRNIPAFREYVLIDQQAVHIEYFHKQENGKWVLEEYTLPDDTLLIASLDLQIRLSDIYAGVAWQE